MYTCPLCYNQDYKYFAFINDKIYCRKCISFIGKEAEENESKTEYYDYKIDYPLSKQQDQISSDILKAFMHHQNTLVNAVCGAGKTELVFKVISYALKNKMQVGFCIPRRDVVIDLLPRFQKAYKEANIITVYGGHNDKLSGDIILLTTHQLYRYEQYFDLLIIDEVDAFPYLGNEVLESFFKRSLRGNYVMLSATPLPFMIENIKKENGVYLTLNKRYHNHPLIEPVIKTRPFIQIISLVINLRRFLINQKPVLIFCPSIKICRYLYYVLSIFFKNGNYVYSSRENKDEIIDNFKSGRLSYLVTSTLLERGITIKNLQVIIYKTEDYIFDKKTLIQISGRVGRKIDAFDGEVIYLCDFITEAMENSIREIKQSNAG